MKVLKQITVCNWHPIPKLVNIIDSAIITSRWADQFKFEHPDMYPLNLSDIKTWSTYSICVHLNFKWINNKSIECNATIYDGVHILLGERGDTRFTATLHIPISFLNEIKDDINDAFDLYCENKYEEYLEIAKKEWLSNFQANLLV